MNKNNTVPQARIENIVVQELENEILIYDLKSNKAFALNATASTIYRACDGKTTFGELKLETGFTDEIIFLSLDKLKKESLLETDSYSSPFTGMSRREVIHQAGLATMIALPVISSLVAPHAAQSASNCPAGSAPADPFGIQGNGNTCGCGTNVGAGNTCSRGTTGAIPSTCRANCICRATNCSPVTNTCVGICE